MAFIPPAFLNTVVPIGVSDVSGGIKWIGTGFLYGLFDKKIDDSNSSYTLFVVTNKHVLQGKKKVYVRFNRQGGGHEDIDISLIARNGRTYWGQHPRADVGAFFVNSQFLSNNNLEFHFFRSDLDAYRIGKLKSEQVTEGDELFLLGYPLGIVALEGHNVICRGGCIARIQDLLSGAAEEYLADAAVFPGNSGGPVLLKPSAIAIQGTKAQNQSALVGIVKSYVPYQDVAISQQTGNPRVMFEENTGLSYVIPVDFIDRVTQQLRRRLKQRAASARWRAKNKSGPSA